MASTSHRVYSDLFKDSNIIRQVAVAQGKNLIIDSLREYFKKDTFYTYRTDGFGFPLIPDHTQLDPSIQNSLTSRIFIGNNFRFDKRYYPSITVHHSSAKFHAIGFNDNLTTKYRLDYVKDNGQIVWLRTPTHRVLAGAWDQTFNVKIMSESDLDRDEIADIVSSFFIARERENLYDSGLFIKSVGIGDKQEEEWANDKIYTQTVILETYSEFRREIPIEDVVEIVNFCFQYNYFGESGLSARPTVDRVIVDLTQNIWEEIS
jgi:hypothetical protein